MNNSSQHLKIAYKSQKHHLQSQPLESYFFFSNQSRDEFVRKLLSGRKIDKKPSQVFILQWTASHVKVKVHLHVSADSECRTQSAEKTNTQNPEKVHWTAGKLHYKCIGIALKLQVNCTQVARKLHSSCKEIALKLQRNCTQVARKLHWNCRTISLKVKKSHL